MRPGRPKKVNLIASVIFREEEDFLKARDFLMESFGFIDFSSELLPFDFTDYYTEEMGKPLYRYILSFEPLYGLDGLHRVKLKTNRYEEETSVSGKRKVNIDPGYLNLNQLVLFTTKNYTHRIYLGDGIFADLTLIYKGGSYQPLPWTYPDYRSTRYIDMFNKLRNIYKEKLRYDQGD